MAISIANASAKDKQSETFLKKAIEGNFAEVSMGDLAQQNGQSDAVKSYGRMLSTDHVAANQKAMDAAKSLEWPIMARCQRCRAQASTECSQHT
jgi:putative membrane protein